ncbi:unnamed protein product [Blepharisma stoltei]|uniref:Uncharacterized protein n=1 Tax=Blepharisma stoltei TaxID=1481888 RepID=A0AAU9JJ41_9CILI|nr:unnamed protein product [Blepharisma stoltei]
MFFGQLSLTPSDNSVYQKCFYHLFYLSVVSKHNFCSYSHNNRNFYFNRKRINWDELMNSFIFQEIIKPAKSCICILDYI